MKKTTRLIDDLSFIKEKKRIMQKDDEKTICRIEDEKKTRKY